MDDPFGVKFEEAIAYLRDKVRLPTQAWTDIWEGMHARAFVVAGATEEALIADFHEAVTKAIEEGRTLEEFREDFDRIVATHGWSYRGSRGWRSRVIYETNMRMAHAAGRWAQIERTKAARSFLRYVAILDDRVRPLHRDWNDVVLPVDDPFWETHYPPNGWSCRCSVQTLSERDVERFGLTVSPEAPPIAMEDRTLRTPDGEVTVRVPAGIDTGFAYNPGIAGFGRGAAEKSATQAAPPTTLIAPGAPTPILGPMTPRPPRAAVLPETDVQPEAARKAVSEAIGGDHAVLSDPLGGRVYLDGAVVGRVIDDSQALRYLPLVPETITDPDEIWTGFERRSDGRTILRRRYVRAVEMGGEPMALVADATGRNWVGWTLRKLDALRTGLRVFRRQQ